MRTSRAEIVGIHLEGPFISKTRRGVHPPGSAREAVGVEKLQKFLGPQRKGKYES